jgi:hypothetical protein
MDEEELYSAVARTQGADAGSEPGREVDTANSDTFGGAAAETSGSEAGGSGMAREGSAASLASKSGSGGPAWASAGAGVAAVAGGGGRCGTQLPYSCRNCTRAVAGSSALHSGVSGPYWGSGPHACALAPRRGNGPAGGGKAWERPGKVRTAPMPVAADPRREHIRVRAALTGGLPKAGMKASSPSSYGTPKGMLSPSAAAAAAPPKVLPLLHTTPPLTSSSS